MLERKIFLIHKWPAGLLTNFFIILPLITKLLRRIGPNRSLKRKVSSLFPLHVPSFAVFGDQRKNSALDELNLFTIPNTGFVSSVINFEAQAKLTYPLFFNVVKVVNRLSFHKRLILEYYQSFIQAKNLNYVKRYLEKVKLLSKVAKISVRFRGKQKFNLIRRLAKQGKFIAKLKRSLKQKKRAFFDPKAIVILRGKTLTPKMRQFLVNPKIKIKQKTSSFVLRVRKLKSSIRIAKAWVKHKLALLLKSPNQVDQSEVCVQLQALVARISIFAKQIETLEVRQRFNQKEKKKRRILKNRMQQRSKKVARKKVKDVFAMNKNAAKKYTRVKKNPNLKNGQKVKFMKKDDAKV